MTQPPYNPAKAFQDARSSVGRAYVNPERNFLTMEEMISFVENSCGNCFCDAVCSNQRMIQHNARECEIDSGMCNLSFPCDGFARLESEGSKVQCKWYKRKEFRFS